MRFSFSRSITLVLLAILMVMIAVPVFAVAARETSIWAYDGTVGSATYGKWVPLTKGYLMRTYTAAAANIGGGYGDTGATIAASGNIQTNGTLTVDGQAALNGGIAVDSTFLLSGSNGSIVSTPTTDTATGFLIDGSTQTSGSAFVVKTIAGTLDGGMFIDCLDDATSKFSVGEGGNVTTAGTLGVTGAATVGSLVCTAAGTFGGGYGSTGATVATTGNIQTNGTLTVDGASTLTGNVSVAGTITGKKAINTTALDTETTVTMNPDGTTHPFGTLYISAAAGATTVTLGAVASNVGSTWSFFRTGAGAFAITGPAGTLVTFNNAAATTATWGTAGQIIGSSCTVFCDGTKWYIQNHGANTVAGS